MRVLAIGSLYPPHHLGGYEVLWQSAVNHMRERGHDVRVLASDTTLSGVTAPDEPDVHRELRWYWREHRFPRTSLRERLDIERHNAAVLDRHIEELDPEVVSWWAMGGMSLSLIERVRRAGLPAVGVVADDWMLYGPEVDGWQRRGRTARLAERFTGIPARVELSDPLWLFISQTLYRRVASKAPPLPNTEIVHPGPDTNLFQEQPLQPWRARLLYCGRIDERKGIDTAIAARPPDCSLVVNGDGDEEHLATLKEMAAGAPVEFTRSPREELPAVYADADAVLFPVRWEEPWGLVPLEAMAVGRPVIASGRGGSGEYLRDGVNCLIAQEPMEVRAAIERLAGDASLRELLREGGLETARRFSQRLFDSQVADAHERRAWR